MELTSDDGLRIDGRRPHELRKVQCRPGIYNDVDGSSYYQQGCTKVIVVVNGPHEASNNFKSRMLSDTAYINCELSDLSHTTGDKRRRMHGDRKSTDMMINLQRALLASVQVDLYPSSQIDVYVQLLETDGSCLAACINASTLALIDSGIQMKEYVVACTASMDKKHFSLVDVNAVEESVAGSSITLALHPVSKEICLLDITQRLHSDYFEKVMEAAEQGCLSISTIINNSVRRHVDKCGSAGWWQHN